MPSEVPPRLETVASNPPPILSATGPNSAAGATVLQGRLHPLTMVVVLVNLFRNFLLPIIVVVLFGRRSNVSWVLLVFLGLGLLRGFVRYFTFVYRIEGGELITRQGILERTERHIPLSRVQDLRLEQGIVHRVLGVVDLHVETASGKGAEASLSVLSRETAESLRRAVFEQLRAVAPSAQVGQPTVAPATPEEIVRRLSTRDLILAGLTSNRAASALVLVFAAWQFLDELLPRSIYERLVAAISTSLTHWFEPGTHTNWMAIFLGGLAVILLGMLLSAAGSVVLFHGFTLSRRGEDLHRVYGLFTRRASSLPRRRIQLLKIEETWLRRLFGLATLRADTAGGQSVQEQQDKDGRDVLLPITRREDLDALVASFLPGAGSDALEWRRVSRRAIRRGTLKGSLVCGLFAIAALVFERGWYGVWPLLFLPLVYALNVASYRHLGYALGETHFRTRRGWLSRATHIVPIGNVQTVVIKQTPLDRRHGVASLQVDTAGQAYTGGGPRIHNLPLEDAQAVARSLAQRASQTRYRW